jgi:hypothetical protein
LAALSARVMATASKRVNVLNFFMIFVSSLSLLRVYKWRIDSIGALVILAHVKPEFFGSLSMRLCAEEVNSLQAFFIHYSYFSLLDIFSFII